ncbi:MAG: VOC family protein [Microthrixaceae bacterium]
MNDSKDMFQAGIPRLNHVAMSVPAELISGDSRAEIVDFYRECFGWTELAEQGEEGRIVVMTVGHWDNFVFLHAEDEPMTAVRLDHFGISVRSREDFDACFGRVRDRAALDERVDVIEPQVEDHGPILLHSFYMRFRLPLMVEVQYWEFV